MAFEKNTHFFEKIDFLTLGYNKIWPKEDGTKFLIRR